MISSNFFAYPVLITLFILSLTSCSFSSQQQTPTSPTVISLEDAFKLLPERKKVFSDALALSVEIDDIQQKTLSEIDPSLDTLMLTLTIYFQNQSGEPLVFRRPKTIGFQGSIGGGDIWDVAFFIQSENGIEMLPSLNTAPILNYEDLASSDFITLAPEERYSLSVEVNIPNYTYPTEKYSGKLLPGAYTLFFIYENFELGYPLPLDQTPPPLASFNEQFEWRQKHTMLVD